MKRWPPQVEKLRQYVVWECKDIPADLVLAIISQESGGVVGEGARAKSKAVMVLDDQGRLVEQNRAFGLMQAIGPLLKTWQDSGKEPKITINDLFGKDERAARAQIILGCWYFANCVRALHVYDKVAFPGHSPGTASDEQLKLSLLAYRMGFGSKSPAGGKGLKPRLDKLQENGWPLTLASVGKAFPLWGAITTKAGKVKWINRPVHFAKTVWNNYAQVSSAGGGQEQGTALAATQPGQPATKTADKGISGMLTEYWPLLAIAAVFIFMKMRAGKADEAEPEKEDELEGAAA